MDVDPPTPIQTQAAAPASSSSSSQAHPLPLYAQSEPHETQSSLAQSLLTEAASPSAQASLAISSSLPAPPPAPSSAFAAAQALAAASANPVPFVEPPPYEVPIPAKDIPVPTGKVGDGRVRLMTDDEIAKCSPAELKELKRKGITLINEEKVKSMSVVELRKKGLGRVASGYCYSARMTMHTPLATKASEDEEPHPEQPARIIGVFKMMETKGLTARMERIAVREAVKTEVLLVHSEGHWDRVRGTGYQSIAYLETCSDYFDRLSLYVNTESAACARLSCGGVLEMCRAVAEGQIRNGFAIVRPPGHHAEPEDAMGFCFFNNASIAAKWLRTVYTGEAAGEASKAIKKVLILDWDVHHGNGTQKAFWDDPNVLYISLHRHDGVFYPGGSYGSAEMVGEDAGKGFSVNIPFPERRMTNADYIYAFQQIVMPIAYEFAPDFVIVSAGYDAAQGDELGQMEVTPEGFAHMTHMLSVLANGKMVLALEGGYNVEAISKSATACVEVLLGDEPRHLTLGPASPSATNAVQEVMGIQSKYWKCMGVPVESVEELRQAGKAIPISEALKAHRTYDLYHEYGLFNIEFANDALEESYKDQLLCSENVYDCETLLIFMHDLGAIKASFSAATMDIHVEKTLLLDTSREVLDWAMRDHKYGVVDVNFLAHLPSSMTQVPDPSRSKEREKLLALYLWDHIVTISAAKNVILFGSGCGCSALMNIVQNRPQLKERVKACISVLGLEPPPELEASSGVRVWYKENSLVILPSTHSLHDDARKAGKHQKKFGNVYRATAEDEGRPIHLLKASLPRIKEFIREKLPQEQGDAEGDVHMADS
ncbi:hypothetical protein RQP46_008848 [Phenoliferia psychrophenolica]